MSEIDLLLIDDSKEYGRVEHACLSTTAPEEKDMGQEEALFESRESLPFESGSPSSVMLESELRSRLVDLTFKQSFLSRSW